MYDVVIKNGKIIDGSGNPWFIADVAIENGRIAAVTKDLEARAYRTIDADGKVVSPGFIDVHTHSDIAVLADPRCESYIRQGVTTQIVGNCGFSVAPVDGPTKAFYKETGWIDDLDVDWTWNSFGEYLRTVQDRGVATNVGGLVGHCHLRTMAMRYDNRKPTADEMAHMVRLAHEAMEDGAFGVSSGLIYVPGCYAETAEVLRLAQVAAQHNALYVTHIRGENDTLLAAVEEAITIGQQSGAAVQISHFKAMGRHMWGKSVDTLAMVDEARAGGLDVTCDQYPYIASGTMLGAFLPPRVYDGGKEALFRRLSDRAERETIKNEILAGVGEWVSLHKGVGWDNVVITNCAKPEYVGKTVHDIATERGCDDFDAAFDLLVELDNQCGVIYYTICEEDIERIMRHPAVMVGSDSSHAALDGPLSEGMPHPRYYGTFARVLGHYVRERKTITLENAVRKMTSLPAQKFGIWNRGYLRAGFAADVVVFDPDTVADKATFLDPHNYAVGVSQVLVNGRVALEAGANTGARAGAILRRS